MIFQQAQPSERVLARVRCGGGGDLSSVLLCQWYTFPTVRVVSFINLWWWRLRSMNLERWAGD